MKNEFKEKIEEIKEKQIESNDTKKYILAVKDIIRSVYYNCKDEASQEQIISEFLKEYEKDLQFRGNARTIYYDIAKNDAYKRVLQDFKGNKQSFNGILREAKKMESTEKEKTIKNVQTEYRQAMVSAVRYIMRTKGVTKDNDIIAAIKEEKEKLEKELRNKMNNIIHTSVGMLDEYGFLDEYIESSNNDLEKLELSELKFSKRNPIADEQYDIEGNLVKDVEDIGVIDALSDEELEKVPLEELQLITAFYESRYFQERLGVSNAMSVIKTLDMWDILLNGTDNDIEEFDDMKIKGALKKDLAINYLCNDDIEITNKMRKQYRKFLKSQGMYESKCIEEEIKETKEENDNLINAADDINILVGLIMQQLKSKTLKMKEWGILEADDDVAVLALESKRFRGPLVMGVAKEILNRFYDADEDKLPKYDKEINKTYSDIMSKLYVPSNEFFKNTIDNAYKNNPESKVIANIAGHNDTDER